MSTLLSSEDSNELSSDTLLSLKCVLYEKLAHFMMNPCRLHLPAQCQLQTIVSMVFIIWPIYFQQKSQSLEMIQVTTILVYINMLARNNCTLCYYGQHEMDIQQLTMSGMLSMQNVFFSLLFVGVGVCVCGGCVGGVYVAFDKYMECCS